FLPAGDIYSLGAILYEIATGQVPTTGDTSNLLATNRNKRLCEIIKKCLSKDPASRYQRAKHLSADLQKLTRKGIWPFRNRNAISLVEIAILPKTLYPPSCTFCEYCGHADPSSQAGYCKKCRVPYRVGRIQWKDGKKEKEFFLYSDETIIGSAPNCHIRLENNSKKNTIRPQHARIFRRKTALWLEAVEKDSETTRLNHRRVLGPIELINGDSVDISGIGLNFTIRDAC
ncbi:MAG: FHA domain-containing protein, partial [Deltaproteobacteria bacterium]|nr:FHA domain-containing protein [Deltaproteobacteria bacterium]